jgi:hypothetical protein
MKNQDIVSCDRCESKCLSRSSQGVRCNRCGEVMGQHPEFISREPRPAAKRGILASGPSHYVGLGDNVLRARGPAEVITNSPIASE